MSDSKPPISSVPPSKPPSAPPAPPTPPAKVVAFDLRMPQNASIREAIALRQEDLLDTIIKAVGGPQATSLPTTVTSDGWRDILQQLTPLLVQLLLARVLKQPKAEPVSPTVHQDFSPPPPPVVVTPPIPPGVVHIVGGRAKITGATKGGPLGPRIKPEVLKALLSGERFGDEILDLRLELDNTPLGADGKDFGADDPRWVGQPSAPHPGEGPIQPFRLKFSYQGDGSADLAHEYANFGCTPRIRVRVPAGGGGALTDLFFEGPDYKDGSAPVRIDVTEGPIFIGAGV